MAETFSERSTQYSFRYNLATQYGAGDTIKILDTMGNTLFDYETQKSGNSIVFSSPSLEKNENYILQVGNQQYTITLTSISTTVGNGAGGRGMK